MEKEAAKVLEAACGMCSTPRVISGGFEAFAKGGQSCGAGSDLGYVCLPSSF